MKLANGIPVVTDCRLSDSANPWLIPAGVRVSNPTPREGCTCTACENGRIDAELVSAIGQLGRFGGKAPR